MSLDFCLLVIDKVSELCAFGRIWVLRESCPPYSNLVNYLPCSVHHCDHHRVHADQFRDYPTYDDLLQVTNVLTYSGINIQGASNKYDFFLMKRGQN